MIDIQGGFGNQLFQFSYAKYLEKNQFKVFINLNNFKRVANERNSIITNRELLIPVSYFGFKEIKYSLFFVFDLVDKLKLNNFDKFRNNTSLKSRFTWINENNVDDVDFGKYNRFTGYWQYVNILEDNKDYIKESLSKDSYLKKSLKAKPKSGSTALHVRRKDYINLNEDLNIDFYENSLNFCYKNIENFHYEVFSDDPEWVEKQELFKSATKIHQFNDSKDYTIQSYGEILEKENFIVGNSTFSLTAAILKSSINSKVLVADPWFRQGNTNITPKSNWVLIPNK